MKSLFIFSALLLGSFSFAQVDLSKKEAFEAFKNSNVRKELNISLKDFNYKDLSSKAKKFKVPLSKMVILNSADEKNLQNIIFDYHRNRPNKEGIIHCIYCRYVIYADINNYYESANEISAL